MALDIKKTRHLDSVDLDRLTPSQELILQFLRNKFIIRMDPSDVAKGQMTELFAWLPINTTGFYSVRGPESDQAMMKYYIYFEKEEDATLFKLTFPLGGNE